MKIQIPCCFLLTGMGHCWWWVDTQLSECQPMYAWPLPPGQSGQQIPKDRILTPRSKPDIVLCLAILFLSLLAFFLLEAETSKRHATPSWWKSCFSTTVDVYTGEATWGGKAFWEGGELVVICAVGGLCSVAYEQLWAVFDKLPCLEIGLALKGLVLWTKSVTMFAASVCLLAPLAWLKALCLV